jgi:hypothetical protein
MRMAYAPELEEPLPTLMEIIELNLTDTSHLIYGKRSTGTIQSDPPSGDEPAMGDLQLTDELTPV